MMDIAVAYNRHWTARGTTITVWIGDGIASQHALQTVLTKRGVTINQLAKEALRNFGVSDSALLAYLHFYNGEPRIDGISKLYGNIRRRR